jgi:hypothetical protein
MSKMSKQTSIIFATHFNQFNSLISDSNLNLGIVNCLLVLRLLSVLLKELVMLLFP